MKTITPRQYELFRQFFKFFKEKTDTDLTPDFNEFLGLEMGKTDVNEIVCITCERLDISIEEFKSKSRKRERVECRYIVAFFLRERGLTLKQVGLTLGGRDHTTAIHAINMHEDLMLWDKSYRDKFNSVRTLISVK